MTNWPWRSCRAAAWRGIICRGLQTGDVIRLGIDYRVLPLKGRFQTKWKKRGKLPLLGWLGGEESWQFPFIGIFETGITFKDPLTFPKILDNTVHILLGQLSLLELFLGVEKNKRNRVFDWAQLRGWWWWIIMQLGNIQARNNMNTEHQEQRLNWNIFTLFQSFSLACSSISANKSFIWSNKKY